MNDSLLLEFWNQECLSLRFLSDSPDDLGIYAKGDGCVEEDGCAHVEIFDGNNNLIAVRSILSDTESLEFTDYGKKVMQSRLRPALEKLLKMWGG